MSDQDHGEAAELQRRLEARAAPAIEAEPVALRPETPTEHIARDMREGCFPEQSPVQMIPVAVMLKGEALRREWKAAAYRVKAERDAALARVAEVEAERDAAVQAERSRMMDWCAKRQKVSGNAWQRAAQKALAGDMTELRNRIDLIDAEPLDIVQSDAALTPQPDAGLDGFTHSPGNWTYHADRTVSVDGVPICRMYAGRNETGNGEAIARLPSLITALRSRPVREVEVKPLVWEARNDRESAASWFGGHYITVKDFDGWRWMRVNGRALADVAQVPTTTEEEAKAAAQANYESRIRAALTEEGEG